MKKPPYESYKQHITQFGPDGVEEVMTKDKRLSEQELAELQKLLVEHTPKKGKKV